MDIINEFDDLLFDQEINIVNEVYPLRKLYDSRNRYQHTDFYNVYDDMNFYRRYRISKNSVMYILDLIREDLEPRTDWNNPLTPLEQLLIGLRFLATNSFYITVGDFAGVHKSTAGVVIARVMTAIANLRATFIKMPSNEEERTSAMRHFYSIARFPRIIGAIDCTHVKVQSPGGANGEIYRNRKGFFSMNVQVVADAELFIRDIVVRWPGSAHDTNIFDNSLLRMKCENREFGQGLLLGDGGYPVRSYLITPLNNPTERAENLFNEAQIRSRNVVERTFGIWKRRFPVLSFGLRCKIPLAQNIIVAAAVIHNIATKLKDEMPFEDEIFLINDDVPDEQAINRINDNDQVRRMLINYFRDLEAM